jgi:RNA polymerase sigma-70 factor, ECF subfamily
MDALNTTTALLDGLLADENPRFWQEFDSRYRPIIRGFALKLGLSYADAEDVTQESLVRFIKYYRLGKYDRARGRLTSWLVAIAQNCIFDLQHSKAGRLERRGESAMLDLSDSSALDQLFDDETRRVVLDRAMAELRTTTRLDERTIRAFQMVALQQRTVADAVAETELSADSIYAAKHRCLSALREILTRLNTVYEIT